MNASPTHWLYPVNSTSGYVLERPGGADVAVTPDTVWEDVQSEHPNSTTWLLSNGYKTMEAGDLVWLYATGKYQLLVALARAVDIYKDEPSRSHHVEMTWDVDVSRALHDVPITRAQFGGQHIQSVQRANAAAIVALDNWLAARRIKPRKPDDPAGSGSDAEARAWTLRQVRKRQGQGPFRARLLQHYSGECAVTGESCVDVLEAAHIQPFAASEDHDVTNGLLLRSDLHTLFDLHLIGVDAKGKLVVSPQVASATYRALHGAKLFLPKSTSARPSPSALANHLAAIKA